MKQSSSIVSIGCVDADSSTVVVSVGLVAVASDIRVLAKSHCLLAALEGQWSPVVGKGNKVRRVARDGLARLEGAGARGKDSNGAITVLNCFEDEGGGVGREESGSK